MKYSLWNNIKFFTGVFFQLLLFFAVFLVGWGMSFTNIYLNKKSIAIGNISSISIQQNRGSRSIPGQMDLIFYLTNEPKGFWIYRQSGDYINIVHKIRIGDTVKIYYDQFVGSNNYYTTFQVENSKGIVYA